MLSVFQSFTPRRKVVERWTLKCMGSFFMDNPMFDALSFQIFEKHDKSTNRNSRNFVHFFSGGGVSQFWVKRPSFLSFSTFYPSVKGRRELKMKTSGVIFHGESIFHCFWKNLKVEKSQVSFIHNTHVCCVYTQHTHVCCVHTRHNNKCNFWKTNQPLFEESSETSGICALQYPPKWYLSRDVYSNSLKSGWSLGWKNS